MNFNMRLITANVQTGIDKYKFFEAQLMKHQAHIFLVQEAKSHERLINSKDFLRYASEGAKHWVEVWFAKYKSFVAIDDAPVYVDESCVSVVSSCPRHLLLSSDLAGHRFYAASVHLPQQSRAAEEKEAAFAVLQKICEVVNGAPCILGMDGNCRVPFNFQTVTGAVYADEADGPGESFAATLGKFSMWVPSTFPTNHTRPVHT